MPSMTKDYSKNIMRRSRLFNKYLKKIIMKKIGKCMPNKEIITSLCYEKLKKLTKKT